MSSTHLDWDCFSKNPLGRLWSKCQMSAVQFIKKWRGSHQSKTKPVFPHRRVVFSAGCPKCPWDSIKVLKTNCPILSGRREGVILSQTKQLAMGRWSSDGGRRFTDWHPLLTCYCKYKYTQFAEILSSFSSQFTLRQMYISNSQQTIPQLIRKMKTLHCLCLCVCLLRDPGRLMTSHLHKWQTRYWQIFLWIRQWEFDENPLESWLWMYQWMAGSQSNLT